MGYNSNYSEELARGHVEKCKSSGLSIAEYCRQHSIRPSTFYSWHKKFKRHKAALSSKQQPSFVTFPLKSSLGSKESIRFVRTEVSVPQEAISEMCDLLHALLGDRGNV